MTPFYSLRRFVAVAVVAVATVAAPAHAAVVDAELSLVHTDDTPQPFRLSAPSPNPFTSSTRLTLTVEQATSLSVAVHDALGRRVALLHDGTVQAGTYTLRVDANDLPPGLYLVRATDGRGQTATRSVSLAR
ncbi:T9SS type A sorting domain-containing protein [Rubrivirga sp.]|uniref:T9SS type A sorting domain-containing protein n=1 Tax=Rubrivirga sp. TaxID=1885344 RepID=UPI003B51C06F